MFFTEIVYSRSLVMWSSFYIINKTQLALELKHDIVTYKIVYTIILMLVLAIALFEY